LKAVKTLSELKGVGPATATMILEAKSDDIPFMSDEAMLQVFEHDRSKLKYDIKTCGTFLNKIIEIVKELKNGINRINVNNKDFSAAEVERALFARELLSSEDKTSQKRASISPPPIEASKKRPVEEKPVHRQRTRKKTKS